MTEYTGNGWKVIPAYGDPALVELIYTEGPKNILGGDVHRVFTLFCAEFYKRVEGIVRKASWGYSPRKIAGTTRWSNHASGTAIDLNSNIHPEYKDTYSAAKKAALRTLLAEFPVITWGGDWSAKGGV